MKFAKKLMSVLLVVLMLATMALPAMADDPAYTITINNTNNGHIYEAYQIFSGTLSADGTVLTGINWGSGVDGPALLAALKTADEFGGSGAGNVFSACTTAEKVAETIQGWAVNGVEIKKFADIAGQHLGTMAGDSGEPVPPATSTTPPYIIGVNEAGYYLIKDRSTSLNNEEDVYTDYMLQVVNSITINPKAALLPTFTHKVSSMKASGYGLAASGEVEAPVYHKLNASLPSNYNDYYQYHLHFDIEIPSGISPATNLETDPGSANAYKFITAKVLHASDPNPTTINLAAGDVVWDGHSLKIDLGNLKAKFTGENSLNLNDTIEVAFVTAVNENNTVWGKGGDAETNLGNVVTATMQFSNDPTQPAGTATNNIQHGKIERKVSVYSYQLEITKVDSVDTSKTLSNAIFKLYRNLTIDGNTTSWYAVVNDNKITGWADNESGGTELTTDANGKILVQGLGSLVYHLKETQAPDSYNKLDGDEQITISATFADQKLQSLEGIVEDITVDGTEEDGKVSGKIRNIKGNVLPATGGMGTTIFYIAGAVLLLGSITAFAVKKRGQN